MAQEMRGHSSFRSLAATYLAPIKDYLPHRDHHSSPYHHHHHHHHLTSEIAHVDGDAKKHSWTHFSSHRFSKRSYSDSDTAVTSTERIVLLPGWASRRYHAEPGLSNRASGAPYDIEVFVSGYVVKHRTPNSLLLKLAKTFASLPKLPDLGHHGSEDNLPHDSETVTLTESADDFLSNTIIPDDIKEELERHVLHQSPKEFATHPSSMSISTTSSNGCPLLTSTSSSTPHDLPPVSHPKAASCSVTNDSQLHHRWHSNLETRLHPFWAGVLSNRTVQISVHPHIDLTKAQVESVSPSKLELLEKPLATHGVVTDADGAFKIRFLIPWDSLCTPKDTPMGVVDLHCEHDFFVTAELMPPPSPPGTPHTPTGHHSYVPPPLAPSIPTAVTSERVTLTHSPVRVISDIDDTVKLSGIHSGARTVFHNVFVKDLEENLIPGMGEWYTEMWRRGVRFHYVSNGPFELLPVITDFFRLAQLPSGSVRLRSYGTRSLFTGLLSPPSERKRDGVVEVLTSFPHSRFVLIGDSGEQDLELYAAVAREHPEQILCIFIRDVNTYEDGGGGIEDPTGIHAREGGKKRSPWGMSMSRGRWSPKSTPTGSSSHASESPTDDYFSRTSSSSTVDGQRSYTDTLFTEPASYDAPSPTATHTATPTLTHRLTLSEPEKKRMHLQTRLWKACAELPTNVVIRIFREPQECVEALQVIGPHLTKESA